MTYNELFKLAQEKGYDKSIILFATGRESVTYDYNESEIDGLLSLALLQKWLRDEHRVDVNIPISFYDEKITWYNWKIDGFIIDRTTSSAGEKLYGFDSYEQALLEGINEALKLIA